METRKPVGRTCGLLFFVIISNGNICYHQNEADSYVAVRYSDVVSSNSL
jgi:hypothetical protein